MGTVRHIDLRSARAVRPAPAPVWFGRRFRAAAPSPMRPSRPRAAAPLRRISSGTILAGLFALMLAVLSPRQAGAQASDAGAATGPGPRAAEAGATTAPAAAPTATDDAGGGGGSDSFDPTLSAAPVVRIPQTEAEKAEGLPIVKIEISGNRRVAVDDISTYLREKTGQLFRVENLSGDVRALWDAGFFDDIEADLERKDQGVLLRLLVRERANSKAIEFSGNDELDNDKLNETIEIKPNTILSVPAVRRSVNKMKDGYSEKGYFLADVEFKIDPQRDNEVIVKFKIKEHQPVSVRRISFIGNEGMSDADLQS